jgi:hypothetical protein
MIASLWASEKRDLSWQNGFRTDTSYSVKLATSAQGIATEVEGLFRVESRISN